MHESIEKYIITDNLDAIIYKDGDMKLQIFNSKRSPYGYTQRNLIVSLFGIKSKEFTFDYVKQKVDEVYSTFPTEEIHELLTKIKLYKNG